MSPSCDRALNRIATPLFGRRVGVSAWADWGRLPLLGVVLYLQFGRRQLKSGLKGLSKWVGTKGLAGIGGTTAAAGKLRAPLYGGRKVASVPISVKLITQGDMRMKSICAKWVWVGNGALSCERAPVTPAHPGRWVARLGLATLHEGR